MSSAPTQYLTEIFRVVEGALRQDGVKVRNYASLLAEKLEQNGDAPSAKRLRRLLEAQGRMLQPTKVNQTGHMPVDAESRFPLVEQASPSHDNSKLILLDDQNATFQDFISTVEHRTELEQFGLTCNASLLLYGPPGCGKSQLAGLAAGRLGLPFYVARLDGLISSYLGSTSKNIRAVLEYATRGPCVLFLDEFDAIAKLRDDQQELGELKRVVNSFIQALDTYSHELIVIAATNHEQLLDSAIWRRFHFHIKMEFPNVEQRGAIWRLYGKELGFSEKQFKVLVDLSEGCSGAAIENICNRLRQRVITQDIAPTLRAICQQLVMFGNSKLSAEVITLNDPKNLYLRLQQRDPSIYTLGTVGELAGVSKATMSRLISKANTHNPE